jgi:hypothetical protein
MSDIFYDIETRELLDQNAPDQNVAIRALHLSVGAAWCECHGEQIFYSAAPLTRHLLAHERIIGFNILRFDNAVLAWAPDRETHADLHLPGTPEELKKRLDALSFDLQADLEARLGHHVGLGALADGTPGKQKMGTAPQAVVWHRFATTLRDRWPYALTDVGDQEGAQRVHELGTWFQERLEQYCMQDVLLVKRIF